MKARQLGHMRRLSTHSFYKRVCSTPPLIKSRLPLCANMSCREKDPRRQIVEIGRLAYQKGWVAANDGNISVRLGADRILATPTGVSKGMMEPEDLIICDLDGNKVEGERECTSEILMHTTIYRMRPDVQAVVHAHPPVATGFAVAGRPLNLALAARSDHRARMHSPGRLRLARHAGAQ